MKRDGNLAATMAKRREQVVRRTMIGRLREVKTHEMMKKGGRDVANQGRVGAITRRNKWIGKQVVIVSIGVKIVAETTRRSEDVVRIVVGTITREEGTTKDMTRVVRRTKRRVRLKELWAGSNQMIESGQVSRGNKTRDNRKVHLII